MKRFSIAIVLAGLPALLQAENITGCYSNSDRIENAVSGEISDASSFFNLTRENGQFYIAGRILGGNFHVCELQSPVEGETENIALPLQLEGNALIYQYQEPDYDIDCTLSLTIAKDTLTLSDENDHCSSKVFSCGANVSLHHVSLSRSADYCDSH